MLYYYDHQKDLEAEIRRRLEQSESLREQFEDKELRRKLQQAKLAQ